MCASFLLANGFLVLCPPEQMRLDSFRGGDVESDGCDCDVHESGWGSLCAVSRMIPSVINETSV